MHEIHCGLKQTTETSTKFKNNLKMPTRQEQSSYKYKRGRDVKLWTANFSALSGLFVNARTKPLPLPQLKEK